MTFTSPLFVVFLAVVSLRYVARSAAIEKWLLLLASYLFYLTSGIVGVLLVIATSSVDFHVAKRIAAASNDQYRKRWLTVSLLSNLGILAVFKYANFALETAGRLWGASGQVLTMPHLDLALPLGISYFTFAGLSYVLDVYYERIEPCRGASTYFLYVAYFPKILAGPIVRAGDLTPQLEERARPTAADVEVGVSYFLLGAIKKLVIADQLAGDIGLIFSAPAQFDAPTLVQGVIGYTVQIYCDFSGYSDMAVGCARIMGVRLPDNFLMPYKAVSVTEFWRRWHVTLSSWFRDYVFIPLELSTKRLNIPWLRASLSFFVTMGLCGLWHGASWNFVVWGLFHGTLLAIHRVWRTTRPLKRQYDRFQSVKVWSSQFMTLAAVMIGWVFFRADSLSVAVAYLARIATWRQDGVALNSPYVLPIAGIVFLAHLFVDKDRNWIEEMADLPSHIRVGAYGTMLFLLSTLAVGDTTPFVYFKF